MTRPRLMRTTLGLIGVGLLPRTVDWRWALGLMLIGVVLVAGLLAPLVAVDPLRIAPADRLHPPGATHWFGTDQLGRDVFARTVHAARVSLTVGFCAALLAVSGGMLFGLLCGLARLFDELVMRLMDLVAVFPAFLLAIALLTLLPSGVFTVILVIAIGDLPRSSRLARSVLLAARERPYVEAARGAGTSTLRILIRHIAPSAWPPVAVLSAYLCASAILSESGLSFLSAGTPAEIPSWGNMIASGARFFIVAPWMVLFPGLALAMTTLGVTLIADTLRDRFDVRRAFAR